MSNNGSVLEREPVSLSDIVIAAIILKPGSKYFKEEALNYAFKRISKSDPTFRGLFFHNCDGTSPENNTVLETTLGFMQIGRALEYTDDWQHVYMTDFGKRSISQVLKERYGEEIFEKLRPVTEEVWKYASEYK